MTNLLTRRDVASRLTAYLSGDTDGPGLARWAAARPIENPEYEEAYFDAINDAVFDLSMADKDTLPIKDVARHLKGLGYSVRVELRETG
ncbi:hypothetical protein CMK11_11480 [Candidatus Poribacteria bacterium]|nr:hypothetical protein [Candidatus Poribacteria bacterium]